MGGQFKEYCVNNHLLAETRRVSAKGRYYCYKCKNVYAVQYGKRNRTRIRQYSWELKLKNQFNMTAQDYIDMYISQDGKCAICLNFIEYKGFLTHIDHCHDKGNFRSLLCSNCNTALGLLKENIEIMHRAIAYVDKHKNTSLNKE